MAPLSKARTIRRILDCHRKALQAMLLSELPTAILALRPEIRFVESLPVLVPVLHVADQALILRPMHASELACRFPDARVDHPGG